MKSSAVILVLTLFVYLGGCAEAVSTPVADESSIPLSSAEEPSSSKGSVPEPLPTPSGPVDIAPQEPSSSKGPVPEPLPTPSGPVDIAPQEPPSGLSASSAGEESSLPEGSGDGDEKPSLPYLPETSNHFEEYPPLLRLAELDATLADRSRNNYTIGGATFFLDKTVFAQIPTEDPGVLAFESLPGSDVGNCVISLFSDHVETLIYIVTEDVEGDILMQVPTLNVALDLYLQRSGMEVFSYYSDRYGEMYIPGAMGQLTQSFGFIFFFTDGNYIYSFQLSTLDSAYAGAQTQVMADLIASFAFETV